VRRFATRPDQLQVIADPALGAGGVVHHAGIDRRFQAQRMAEGADGQGGRSELQQGGEAGEVEVCGAGWERALPASARALWGQIAGAAPRVFPKRLN